MEEVFRAVNVNVPSDKGFGLVNLNLSVRAGEILGIFTNRYSGRNKLMSLMMGETEPESGFVFWNGDPRANFRITKLSSESRLIDEMQIWESMALLWGKHDVCGLLNASRLRRMIALLLEDYGYTFQLNQRVYTLTRLEKLALEVLAARRVHTRILLIDSTDIEGTTREYEQFKNLLTRVTREGMAVVFISYQMAILSFLSERIAFLHQGRILKVVDREKTSLQEMERMVSTLFRNENELPGSPALPGEEILAVRNLKAGLSQPVSFAMHRGEFVVLVSPKLELFSILQERISEGRHMEDGEVFYQGAPVGRLRSRRDVCFLNTVRLEQLVEELSPMENLYLGLAEKVERFGFVKKDLLNCLEEEFDSWYGHKGILRRKDCSSLYRKDRIAINLFRLRLMKTRVIICNDLSIHNDVVTYRLVMSCLAEHLNMGTAVCMVTGDITFSDEIVRRYVLLN